MIRTLPVLALLGCHGGSDTGPVIPAPDVYCPGDPSGMCAGTDGPLEAGAAIASAVPACFESWTDANADYAYAMGDGDVFLDCGCDRLCPTDDGYVAPDQGEGDGVFQAAWLAGFGNGRAAMGVRDGTMGLRGEGDGLWARGIVLKDGDETLAIVAIDLVGWFNGDVVACRDLLKERGVDVDHLIVTSTHTHQGADSLGQWGSRFLKSGYTPEYRDQLREAVVDVVTRARAATVPVSMVVGSVHPSDYDAVKGAANVVGDTRDPYIVYDDLGTARFVAADGSTVATLINWANHPETRSDTNNYLSSDYVHALRATVEDGVVWNDHSRAGIGGVAIYLNGAVGGMMTALHISVTDPDGNEWRDSSWEKTDAEGQLVGEMALDAIEHGETIADPDLSFRMRRFRMPVDNLAFQTMFLAHLFDRELYDYDATLPIDPNTNLPNIETEVDQVRIGPLELITIPGETLPELFVGGYDGSGTHSPGVPVIDPGNPNPPDLALAPAGPYWRDEMSGGTRWLVGLGNDELGYIIPPYNFEVHPTSPWFAEAEGDHYEETNSLGANTAPMIETSLRDLLAWEP